MTTDLIPAAAQEAVVCSPLSDVDSTAVAQMLESIALMPLYARAAGRNQSLRSLLGEMTGLSKARIAQGRLDMIRESRLLKARQHALNWLAEQIGSIDSEPLDQVIAWEDAAPRTRSGVAAFWAGWICGFEWFPVCFPISKAIALCVDELIEELRSNCMSDDLDAFKQTWLHHLKYHGNAVRVGDEPLSMPADPAQLDALDAMSSWGDARKFSATALDALYFDVVAAVDAEWGDYYFSGKPHLPMCPLVMVRPQDGLVETRRAVSRRNVFYRPSRRLLELLFALSYFNRHKRWPAKAPGPKALALALDDPGAEDEKDAVTEAVISNYFDGTRKLTIDLTYEYWDRLQRWFRPEQASNQRLTPPIPVITFALHWEETMIQNNQKSISIVDLEAYGVIWAHRRRQCLAKREGGPEDVSQAGRSKAEFIEWPAWMTSQSSVSPL